MPGISSFGIGIWSFLRRSDFVIRHFGKRDLGSASPHRSFAGYLKQLLPCGIFRVSVSASQVHAGGAVSPMQIWPAIDLRGGKCVRLEQGDYNRETVFADDPAAAAVKLVESGAECLHLVDLDGAREGKPVNLDAIRAIVSAVEVPCELGGGIRDEATIRMLIDDVGLSRLVIGTKALRDPQWFHMMVEQYAGTLALGIDARNGMVATDGWLQTSTTPAIELVKQFEGQQIAAIIYTDISRDGMLEGPNLEAMQAMRAATELPVIASGGVTTAADVAALAKIGMAGCIIGRALYEGRLTLQDALAAGGKQGLKV